MLMLAQTSHAQRIKKSNRLPIVEHKPLFPTRVFNPLSLQGLAQLNHESILVTDFRVGYVSNTIDVELVRQAYNNQRITHTTLDRNYHRSKINKSLFEYNATVGGTWQRDSSRIAQGIYLSQRSTTFLRLSQGLTGLVFYGNAPYENQTLDLHGWIRSLHYRQLQYALTVRLSPSLSVTGTAGVLQGLSVHEAKFDGSLYTATSGDDLNLNYGFNFDTYHNAAILNANSKGVMVGGGFLYHKPNTAWYLEAGMMETGWLWSRGATYYRADSSVLFDGVKINNAFALSDSSFVNLNGDSVKNYLGIKQGTHYIRTSIPAKFYASFLYRFNSFWSASLETEITPTYSPLPYAALHGIYQLNRPLVVDVYVNTMYFNTLNMGLGFYYRMNLWSDKTFLQLMFQSGYLNAFADERHTRGIDVGVGVSLHL